MHGNDLVTRLNFQKSANLTRNERVNFLFGNDGQSASAQSMSNAWPKSWSSTDRHANIEVGSPLPGETFQNQVHFIGTSNEDDQAASVRSDFPIPTNESCRAVYYFEIKIVDSGEDGFIGIGLSSANSDLNCLPGWRSRSYGYHGDDGKKFENGISHRGKVYGPTFTTNDIIGCGFNIRNRSCFFTKNGTCIGLAFKNIDMDRSWFPTVGMNSPKETIEANFGDKPFVYNIEFENILQEAHAKDLSREKLQNQGDNTVRTDYMEHLLNGQSESPMEIFDELTS